MVGEKEFFERVVGGSMHDTLEFLGNVERNLGPEGSGVLHIPAGLSELECDHLYDRLVHPAVKWLDSQEVITNERGMEVNQKFSTYALKLQHEAGDAKAPRRGILALATRVQSFVRSLSAVYPALGVWKIDEAVAQRYDGGDVGLTWHKDRERHPGVIVTASISGSADLYHRTKGMSEGIIHLERGDLVVVRATGLHSDYFGDLRPEHAVHNVQGDRISLTFRANSRPDDPIPDFPYNNWEAGTGTDNEQ
jgi:hypothetical protein